MARIYISCTFLDLGTERLLVDQWLRKNGHEPVGSTGPDSRPVLESCLVDIDTCQLYVLLQGHRYGHRPTENNPEDLSITCLEYRHAGSRNIPRIVLQRTGIPHESLSDIYKPDEMAKVKAFRDEVAGTNGVRPAPFNDEDSLIAALREGVDKELKRLGLAPGIVAVLDAVRLASRALLSWPSTLPGGEWLPRPELATLQQRIRDDSQSVTLLLGEPGCGKSALLARLGRETEAVGMPVLAIKADFLPEDILTQPALGVYLGFPTSPLTTLRTIAEAGPVLVLLDQLDALADLVVQRSARLRPLLELIHDLANLPNVHVIASCRAFEQRHDPNLRLIEALPLTLELPSWEDVSEVLTARGIQANGWNAELRDTLRSPHALDTFLTLLKDTDEAGLLTSFQGMLQMQWEKKVLAIPGERKTLLLGMARRMAEEEMLWLPLAWFEDRYATVRELVAEGMLRLDEGSGRLQFRHQTLYEFVRARGFLDRLGSLTQAILAGQNSIRIRPQLWYALQHTRQVSPELYQQELARLWSPDLRPHLRMLLIEFLGTQRIPLAGETRLAWLNYDDPWFQRRFLNAVVGSPGWFENLAPDRLPLLMAQPAETAALALPILEQAMAFAGGEVLAMVDQYWLPHPDKDTLTWRLLAMGNTAPLDAACVDRLERIASRTDLAAWTISHTASQISALLPNLAPRLVVAWLNQQWHKACEAVPESVKNGDEIEAVAPVATFRERPASTLLESRELHDLPAIAEAAPQAFVEAIWPLFLELLETVTREAHSFVVGYRDAGLLVDDPDEDTRLEKPLPTALFLAVETWAKTNPATFLAFARNHADKDYLLVQHLLATGLRHCVGHAADEVLEFLCADPRRLVIGPYSEPHRDTKKLIEALAPYLASGQLHQLEQTILNSHRYSRFPDDDAETRMRRLRWDREHRLRLLRGLPRRYMSQEAQRVLDEEERAFPGLSDKDIWFSGFHSVDSPVSAEQMEEAKDEDVLNLFAELTDETSWDHPRHRGKGGAIQAGRSLAKLAESDAVRAVRLIRQLQPGKNEGPVGDVLRALPKTGFDVSALYALIEELLEKGFDSAEFQRDISHAIHDAACKEAPVPDRLLDHMDGWLVGVDPASENLSSEKRHEGSLLWGHGGWSIQPSGNYPVLAALSRACLVVEPPLVTRWLVSLENHLGRSESTRVWAAIAERYLVWLHLADRGRAQAFLDQLFQRFPEMLQHHEGILFMAYLQRWITPEYARRWLSQMETMDATAAQGAGEILMLRRAWFPDEAWPVQRIDEWLSSSEEDTAHQRIGLAYSVAHLWSEPDFRAVAHAYLLPLMANPDAGLAQPLGEVLLAKTLFPDRPTWEWLDALCEHPSLFLDQRSEFLLEHLETLVVSDPVRVARVCNKLLDVAGEAMRDISTRWYLTGEPLSAIALSLQDMGEPYRADGVALFERMLEFNLPQAKEMALSLDKRMPIGSSPPRPKRRRQRSR
jgi:hypothetical protein